MPAATAASPLLAVEALREEPAAGGGPACHAAAAGGGAGNGMRLNAADGPDAATGTASPRGRAVRADGTTTRGRRFLRTRSTDGSGWC